MLIHWSKRTQTLRIKIGPIAALVRYCEFCDGYAGKGVVITAHGTRINWGFETKPGTHPNPDAHCVGENGTILESESEPERTTFN